MALHPVSVALLALLSASAVTAAERTFPVTGFDRVAASGSEDIVITTGTAASVVATGPQERLDRLDIRVDGTTLRIGHKRGGSTSWGWNKDATRIRIALPALHGISLSGSGDVTADKGTGPAFAASLAGSGDLKIGRIDSPTVALSTAGSGDIAAGGKCETATVAIAGSGDMNLAGLECRDLDVRISGSGDVAARATGTANVRISGSGDVTIAGGAHCQMRTSGSGSVNCS